MIWFCELLLDSFRDGGGVTDFQVSKKILSKKMKFVGDDVIGVTTQIQD